MKNTALLVVDVQQGLMADHPYQESSFLDALQQLIRHCRKKEIPVIYVQHTEPSGEILEEGCPAWQVTECVAPLEKEARFQKTFNSAFFKTDLHPYLQGLGVKTIILTGMQTEYCLDATCKSAFEKGYSVIMSPETNTTFDNAPLAAAQIHDFYNRNIWNDRFARVIPTADLLRM